jgi:hypothetical protein
VRATRVTGRRCRSNGGRAGAMLGGDCWVDDGRCGGRKSAGRAGTMRTALATRTRERATMGNDGELWGSLCRHEGGCRARLRTTQGSAGRQQSVSQCRKQRSRKTGRAVRSIGGAQQQQRQRQRQRGRNHGAAQRQPSGIISFGGEVGVEPEVAHKMDGLGGAHWAQALADKLCARCSLAVQMVPT